eukprot:TRINITY_DN37593_c0_g1_i1.p1 TRINITY_DN37593_c0_g1~~TRINITY_DN37593_c0_g1_i1.p1  ORF type:complete len:679 (+),score=60.87 TRINITY_DN37593_c0_g1_i1:109-2037(+)
MEFRALETAKTHGWKSGNLDNIFNKYKSKTTQSMKQKDTSEMRTIMQAVLCEIDQSSGNLISKQNSKLQKFMDICCGPGGFTEYVLARAPNAVGMGITLPAEQGGHGMVIPNSEKFWCQYVDILEGPNKLLFCPPGEGPSFVPKEYEGGYQRRVSQMNQCDLIILDGHYLSGTDRNNPLNNTSTSSGEGQRSVQSLMSSRPIGHPPGFPTPRANTSGSSPLPAVKYINNLLTQVNLDTFSARTTSQVNHPGGGTLVPLGQTAKSDLQSQLAQLSSYPSVPTQSGGGNLVPLRQSAQSDVQMQLGSINMLPRINSGEASNTLAPASLYDFPSGDLPSVPSSMLPAIQTHLLNQNYSQSQFQNAASNEVTPRDPEEVSFDIMKNQSLLLVSQLLIAMQNLAEGGNLIMRSSTKPDFYVCILTCLLRKVFRGEVKPVKPTVSHMMRSSFYVVYKDFDVQASKDLDLVRKFERMLAGLQNAQQGESMWPKIEGVPEFSNVRLFVQLWGPSLLSFMNPLWRFQTLALTAMAHDEGSGRVMGMVNKSKMCFYHVLGQCKRIPSQCWYAHDIEQLSFILKEACKTKFMALVAPWSPLTRPQASAHQSSLPSYNRQQKQTNNPQNGAYKKPQNYTRAPVKYVPAKINYQF